MGTNLHRRRSDRGPAVWLRVLFAAGVMAAAALMAWQISSALDSSHAAAVRALKQSEQRNAQIASRAASNAQLAADASRRAVQAQQLAQAIAASRLRDCEEANQRHQTTVSTFNRILTRAVRSARRSQRAQLRRSRKGTLALIDAIVPHRDCATNP